MKFKEVVSATAVNVGVQNVSDSLGDRMDTHKDTKVERPPRGWPARTNKHRTLLSNSRCTHARPRPKGEELVALWHAHPIDLIIDQTVLLTRVAFEITPSRGFPPIWWSLDSAQGMERWTPGFHNQRMYATGGFEVRVRSRGSLTIAGKKFR